MLRIAIDLSYDGVCIAAQTNELIQPFLIPDFQDKDLYKTTLQIGFSNYNVYIGNELELLYHNQTNEQGFISTDFIFYLGTDKEYEIATFYGESFKLKPACFLALVFKKIIYDYKKYFSHLSIPKIQIAYPDDFTERQKNDIIEAFNLIDINNVILVSKKHSIMKFYETFRLNKKPTVLILNLDDKHTSISCYTINKNQALFAFSDFINISLKDYLQIFHQILGSEINSLSDIHPDFNNSSDAIRVNEITKELIEIYCESNDKTTINHIIQWYNSVIDLKIDITGIKNAVELITNNLLREIDLIFKKYNIDKNIGIDISISGIWHDLCINNGFELFLPNSQISFIDNGYINSAAYGAIYIDDKDILEDNDDIIIRDFDKPKIAYNVNLFNKSESFLNQYSILKKINIINNIKIIKGNII